ncbi:MAG: ATP-binding protein [Novosphingobium sp.]
MNGQFGRMVLRFALLAGSYGVAFFILHRLAAYWGRNSTFSLWFPAAGLRFAFLWHFPPRFSALVIVTEVSMHFLTGVITGPTALVTVMTTMGSSVAYAGTIFIVKTYLSRGNSSLTTFPMPVGFAMLLCPLIGAVLALPWALFGQANSIIHPNWQQIIVPIGTYWIGDLLGILVVAPPLLWLADTGRPRFRLPPGIWEAVIVIAAGSIVSVLVWLSTNSVHIEPLFLCAIWVALRLGRMVAWVISAIVAIMVLLLIGVPMSLEQRASLHLLAVSLAIASYLVGSYSDAETQMRHTLLRKDRLLLQADRLKTLRAMSVAVIHDISQPLSTLSIEARYMLQLAQAEKLDRKELTATGALIDRKVTQLADMIRHMRLFGSDRADTSVSVAVPSLLADVAALMQAEAKAAEVSLSVKNALAVSVSGREVELQQALVNLVRNAIAASLGGAVIIGAEQRGDEVQLNVCDDGKAITQERGMGLGLIIARSIAEAHGGRISNHSLAPSGSCYTLVLPLLDASHERG